MALIDQEDKGRKESSEESFITKLKPLLASYVIATTLHYSHVYQIK